MWIFTRDGFFSTTTDKRTDGANVMVRARVREDLERLVKAIDGPTLEPLELEILESKRADYRYRVVMPRGHWVAYVANAAMDIDYTNVKDTLAPTKTDPVRHGAMMKVWSAMYALQPGGRSWGSLIHPDDDDDWWKEDSLWEAHSGSLEPVEPLSDDEWLAFAESVGIDPECVDCGESHDPNEHCPTH